MHLDRSCEVKFDALKIRGSEDKSMKELEAAHTLTFCLWFSRKTLSLGVPFNSVLLLLFSLRLAGRKAIRRGVCVEDGTGRGGCPKVAPPLSGPCSPTRSASLHGGGHIVASRITGSEGQEMVCCLPTFSGRRPRLRPLHTGI